MRTVALIGICLVAAILFLYCAAKEKYENHRSGVILMSALGILTFACVVMIVCLPM